MDFVFNLSVSIGPCFQIQDLIKSFEVLDSYNQICFCFCGRILRKFCQIGLEFRMEIYNHILNVMLYLMLALLKAHQPIYFK